MDAYQKSSKKTFPTFNKKKDTVITNTYQKKEWKGTKVLFGSGEGQRSRKNSFHLSKSTDGVNLRYSVSHLRKKTKKE